MKELPTEQIDLLSEDHRLLTLECKVHDLQEYIHKNNETKDALLVLFVERIKQLEIICAAQAATYRNLNKAFGNVSDDLAKIANSVDIINGYTEAEIKGMNSIQYYEKVLKPLGVSRGV
jgi:uncharacterized coiled-coil protein SlyX